MGRSSSTAAVCATEFRRLTQCFPRPTRPLEASNSQTFDVERPLRTGEKVPEFLCPGQPLFICTVLKVGHQDEIQPVRCRQCPEKLRASFTDRRPVSIKCLLLHP